MSESPVRDAITAILTRMADSRGGLDTALLAHRIETDVTPLIGAEALLDAAAELEKRADRHAPSPTMPRGTAWLEGLVIATLILRGRAAELKQEARRG